jgi:cytochrome c2
MKVLLFIATLTLTCSISGCAKVENRTQQSSVRDTAALMTQYGCPACHVIRHVPGAAGKVGPPLTDLAQRSYLAGTLQNTPENLRIWIQHPQRIHPGTAMPEMGVTAKDAEIIARFLQQDQ